MSFRPTLLLLTLLAPALLAQVPLDDDLSRRSPEAEPEDDPRGQAPPDDTFFPEGLPAAPGAAQAGIEATGDTAEVRALTAWAEEHRQTDPRKVQQVAERALALARELEDHRGMGESLATLGHLARASDPRQAATYYTEALEAFEQSGVRHRFTQTRINLGNALQNHGAVRESLTQYFAALEEFERLADVEGQVKVLSNIALIYNRGGDSEIAIRYFENAYARAEASNDTSLILPFLNNYGYTLTEWGAYERAEAHLRNALALSREWGSRSYEAMTSGNLGTLFNRKGEHSQALPFLLAAEGLVKEHDGDAFLVVLLASVYDELGDAYLGLGRYDLALGYGHKGLTLAIESGSINRQMEVHQTLSQTYEAAGNDTQALAHYRQYASARDSLLTVERAEILAEMQTRYETEKQKRANEHLEQQNRIQTLQLILLLGGVGALLLVLGVLFYRYRLKQRANRLLKDLDRTKSRFFANISHEFRTPLTVILGGLQDTLAGRFGKVSETLASQQQAMLRNTRQLQRLADEVLDLDRLEAGKLELNLVPGDLVRSLRRIVRANAPLAERNGIDFTFESDVERCPRLFDEEKLEKIVGNLLSNALKFTPKGGSVRMSLNGGKETEIIVSDDGPGIPEDAQEDVFERFAQVEDGALHGGAGIGLALAKELAELHGGTITLESKPGKGSTFTVRLSLETVSLDDVASTGLPRRSSTEPGRSPLHGPEPVAAEELVVGGDGESPSPTGRGGRGEGLDRTTVLVIEDNADVRAYVQRSLEETYRVIEAADGETGLQQARTELPDLIVSDVMLPPACAAGTAGRGIDGYEVTRRLKAKADTECIPVVMLTARAAEEDQTEGYSSGAEVYLTKPFSPETLRAAVARLLEERRRLQRHLQKKTGRTAEKQERKQRSRNGRASFSDRVRNVVLNHLHEESLTVKDLASALHVTRHTLYNRLMSEVGASPTDFVRTLRLERARELLYDGAGTVSEIAYAVGFNSLSVFSRNYRTHYGVPPSTHLSRETKAA